MDNMLEIRDFMGRCTATIAQLDLMGMTLEQLERQTSAEVVFLLRRGEDELLMLRKTLLRLRDCGKQIFAESTVRSLPGRET